MRRPLAAIALLATLAVLPAATLQETFPADAVTDTVAASLGAYVDDAGTATVDPAYENPTGKRGRLLVKFPLSAVPSTDAVLAAHVWVVARKSPAENSSVWRLLQDWDANVTHTTRDGTNAWGQPMMNAYVPRQNGDGYAEGDTMWSSSTYDRLTEPEATVFVDAGFYVAGDTLVYDVTSAVRKWHSGAWANYGLVLTGADTTSTSNIGQVYWTGDAVNGPRLVVTHGPVRRKRSRLGAPGMGVW